MFDFSEVAAVKVKISEREKEVFRYLDKGCSTNEIARYLFISPKTVRNHISNVKIRFNATDRYDALAILHQRCALY
jgi:DNA-binding CsgD family transcriptional regulator